MRASHASTSITARLTLNTTPSVVAMSMSSAAAILRIAASAAAEIASCMFRQRSTVEVLWPAAATSTHAGAYSAYSALRGTASGTGFEVCKGSRRHCAHAQIHECGGLLCGENRPEYGRVSPPPPSVVPPMPPHFLVGRAGGALPAVMPARITGGAAGRGAYWGGLGT